MNDAKYMALESKPGNQGVVWYVLALWELIDISLV
jgi:hypothetical protein